MRAVYTLNQKQVKQAVAEFVKKHTGDEVSAVYISEGGSASVYAKVETE